jgi:hypothetical protein
LDYNEFVMDETLSIKVPRQTKIRLRAAARNRKTTPSALLREALDLVVAGESSGQPSLYELSRDLFEDLGGGPRDLSTNPRHLRDFGK